MPQVAFVLAHVGDVEPARRWARGLVTGSMSCGSGRLLFAVDEFGGEVFAVLRPGEVDPGAAVVDEAHLAAAKEFAVAGDGVEQDAGAVGADAEGEAGGGAGAVDGHGLAVGAAGDDFPELGDLPADGDDAVRGGGERPEGEAIGLRSARLGGRRTAALDVELPSAVPGAWVDGGRRGELGRGGGWDSEGEEQG